MIKAFFFKYRNSVEVKMRWKNNMVPERNVLDPDTFIFNIAAGSCINVYRGVKHYLVC
jgi:hypothetical protein